MEFFMICATIFWLSLGVTAWGYDRATECYDGLRNAYPIIVLLWTMWGNIVGGGITLLIICATGRTKCGWILW